MGKVSVLRLVGTNTIGHSLLSALTKHFNARNVTNMAYSLRFDDFTLNKKGLTFLGGEIGYWQR
jgi:hypothetical protein